MSATSESVRSMRRRRARRGGIKALAVTTVAALATFGTAAGASAAAGDESAASATFLSGSVAGIPLSTLVDLEGAAAANNGTPPAVVDFDDLDLTVLSTLNLQIGGGIQIPLDGVDAGVVGQYALADSNGTSTATSGAVNDQGAVGVGPVPGSPPGPLTVDLTNAVNSLTGPGLAGLVDELADVDLTLGAATATASLNGATGITRDYEIAGGQLTIGSNTLAAVGDTLQGVIDDLGSLEADVNASLTALFGPLGGVVSADVDLDASSVSTALTTLLTVPLTDPAYPGVSIDLGTGTILVDLDQMQTLNDQGEGTDVLDTDTLNAITDAVIALVGGLTDSIDTTIVPGLEGIAVTGDVAIDDLPLVGDVEILTLNTTVGALLDGDTTGISVLTIPLVPVPGVSAVLAALLAPLDLVADPLLDIVDNLDDAVLTVLDPAITTIVPLVVTLTVNNQSEDAGIYSETAAILTVLPGLGAGGALVLNLANATVGPNVIDPNADVAITDPVDGAVILVPNLDDTIDVPVSGTGQPNAEVNVTIPGQPTQTTTVTDPGGTWSVVFDDLPIGDYTATATQPVDGSTDTVSFEIAEIPDVTIGSPVDDQVFSVADPTDDVDVPVSGTGAEGAVIEVVLSGDGTATETATVTGGVWSVSFDDLPVGEYTATATQDADGSVATVDFAVADADDVAILVPADGAEIVVNGPADLANVPVSGTGAPGATVSVSIPGSTLTDVVELDGTWEVEFLGLPVGTYTAEAVQDIDDSTDDVTFAVVAAADVEILQPTDGQWLPVADPAATRTVTVSGTGEAGFQVTVSIPGLPAIAPVTVLADDTWSVDVPAVPVGDYTATAAQSDGSEDTVDFSVVAATDVEILQPTPDQVFSVNGPADTQDVTVSGTGFYLPGSVVTVEVTVDGVTQDAIVAPDGAWTTTFDDLPVGDYAAEAVQDIDGSSDEVDFSIVEETDVEIQVPANGSTITVGTPTSTEDVVVSGIGFTGAVVTVGIPGQPSQTSPVVAGEWSVTFPGLGTGGYTATAFQDVDGSFDSTTFTIVAADALVILQPTEGQILYVADPGDDRNVVVSGIGEIGFDVDVTIPGFGTESTTVTPFGTWFVTFEDVAEGDYTATAVQEGGATDTVSFTVAAADDIQIDTPFDGQVFPVPDADDTENVLVSGSGEPFQQVEVTIGTQVLETTVTPGGTWQVTFSNLPIGDYTATAVQFIEDQEESSASVDFSIEEITDVAITEPEPFHFFFVPGPDDTTSVTVEGTGYTGETVTVSIPGQPSQTSPVIGGVWSVTFDDLGVAVYTATAIQSGDDSTDAVTFQVIDVEDVTITSPEDGDTILVEDPGDTTPVEVCGTGQPGYTIEVTIGPLPTVTTTVVETGPDAGTWCVTVPNVPEGEWDVTAEQPSDDSSETITIIVREAEDVVIDEPTDGEVIPADGTTDVEVSGTGEPGQTITLVLDGGADTETTVVDQNGDWTDTFEDVPAGAHTVEATQEFDGSTDEVSFEVEDITDVAILVPTDGAEFLVNGPADTTPVTVSGTGYSGETVTVSIPGLAPQSGPVVNGEWSVLFPAAPVGTHTATAVQTGDDSTDTVTFIVSDRDDVTITTPEDGEEIVVPNPGDDTDIEVCGTGDPGATIEVTVGPLPTVTTVVEDSGPNAGIWCVTVPDVPEGEHEVVAEQPSDDSEEIITIIVRAAEDVAITSPAPGAQLTVPGAGATTTVPVTGTGEPGYEVIVVLDGDDDTAQETVVGTDGTWTVEFEGVGVGDHQAEAEQQDGSTAMVDFAVVVGAPDTSKARADVTQTRIVRGPTATQTVVMTGFQPGETISGTVTSTPFELIPVTADASGNARITFAVGPAFELGQHRIDIRGSVTGELPSERENTGFVVLAPAAASTGNLPSTGSDGAATLWAAGTGLALLIAGAAIYTLRRRPSQQ